MEEPQRSTTLAYDAEDEYRPEPPPEPQMPTWQDGTFRIGIHTSIAGDIAHSLDIAAKLGANALQIFSSSPRMWPRLDGGRIPESDVARFRARREELGLGPVVVHTNYLINLASPDRVMRARSIHAFHGELVRAVALGADFLVTHPGSGRGISPAKAIAAIADGLRQAARRIRLGHLCILLENTSGMGHSTGSRFEELSAILDACPDLPLGVCLDTAHTFEAGYDLRSEAGLEATLAALGRTVGLGRVFVLHVNDSKTPLGSRVDRHQHLGKGKIGLEALRRLLNHPRLAPREPLGLPGRAFLLETPIDRPGDDRRNVRKLWELVGISPKQAPRAEDGFSMLRTKSAGKVRRSKPSGSRKGKPSSSVRARRRR